MNHHQWARIFQWIRSTQKNAGFCGILGESSGCLPGNLRFAQIWGYSGQVSQWF
jgi:hypothetical protein